MMMFCVPYHRGAIDLQTVTLLAGDFNTNLNTGNDRPTEIVNNFIQLVYLHRCDDLFRNQKTPTYINTALDQENQIDYRLTSAPSSVSNFQVLDTSVNFSDHVSICMSVILTNAGNTLKASDTLPNYNNPTISQLRWDKASYYYHTYCR